MKGAAGDAVPVRVAAGDAVPVRGAAREIAPVSVAPMMEWTDRHFRYFLRRITQHTLLYTEMITAAAIIHGDRDHLLTFHQDEHPLALQLGGDDPDMLARAVEIASPYGYDQFNLNVGCPSERVQSGNFGACLMADPPLVARIVKAMQRATDRRVTVKHRIGIDGREKYEEMRDFVDTVADAGVRHFTVHARIAVLGGLSPRENRTIPPIRYEDVYRLKEERRDLVVELNGEVRTTREIHHHLTRVDAVMLGRAAYENPWIMATVDQEFFPQASQPGEPRGVATLPPAALTRESVARAMIPYLDELERRGVATRPVLTHMLGLFTACPGARRWRRRLSGRLPAVPARELLLRALEEVPPDVRAIPVVYRDPPEQQHTQGGVRATGRDSQDGGH